MGRYKQRVKRRKSQQSYNQSSRVGLINAGDSHNTFSPGFAPSSLASCFPPASNAHLPLPILQVFMYLTILSWALISSHSAYPPWIFASSSTGLNYHAIYADVSPVLNSKPELPPKPHTIQFNSLLDSFPWIFCKYLRLNIKTQPTGASLVEQWLGIRLPIQGTWV